MQNQTINLDGMSMPNLADIKITPGSGNRCNVVLLCFSPRIIPVQTLRPYNWQVTDGLIEHISSSCPEGMRESVGNTPQGMTPDVSTAVMPDVRGFDLHTDFISQRWTFMMMIDQPCNGGTTRHLYGGFFNDEVFAPGTLSLTNPIPNQKANLVFTTMSSMFMRTVHAPGGITRDLASRHSSVITPNHIGNMVGNHKSVYSTSPHDLVKFNSFLKDGSAIRMWGELDLSHNKGRYHSSNLTDKSPKNQLREVVGAVESACGMREASRHVRNSMDSAARTFMDEYGEHQELVKSNLCNNNDPLYAQAPLDPTVPVSLETLHQTFGNVTVFPFKMDSGSPWEVRPQSGQNPHNVMSSLVANMVEATAVTLGIGSIVLRYNSWQRADPMGPPGAWSIEHVQMVADTPQATIKHALTMFKTILERDLFIIIKHVVGDFDLMMHYNNAQSAINLHLLDFENPGGTYETCGSLGGLCTPTIGQDCTVEHNSMALDTLISGLGLKNSSTFLPEEMDLGPYNGLDDMQYEFGFEGKIPEYRSWDPPTQPSFHDVPSI
jgi:hypothetical protein